MKKGILVVLVGGAMVVVALGTFLAYPLSPEQRLRSAVVRLLEAPTAHIRFVGHTTMPLQPAGDVQRVVFEAEGDLVLKERGDSDLAAHLTITASAPGATFSGAGELRSVDRQVFLKIDEVPILLPGLAALRGKWYAFPQSAAPSPSSVSLGALAEQVRERELFREVTTVGSDRVGGVRTTHLRASVAPDGFQAIIEHVLTQGGTALSAEQKQHIVERARVIGTVPLEFWLDRKNSLRKLVADLPVGDSDGHAMLTFEFSRLGEPVQVTAPEGALPLPTAASPLVPASNIRLP